jgi:cytochrome c oxidase assembly factor 3
MRSDRIFAAASSDSKKDLASVVGLKSSSSSLLSQPSFTSSSPPHKSGILVPILERRFPQLLDPTRKTLVWGAPPVDHIGRMGDPRK